MLVFLPSWRFSCGFTPLIEHTGTWPSAKHGRPGAFPSSQMQINVRVQESWVGVLFHQAVHFLLGCIKTAFCRLRDAALDGHLGVVVNVDLFRSIGFDKDSIDTSGFWEQLCLWIDGLEVFTCQPELNVFLAELWPEKLGENVYSIWVLHNFFKTVAPSQSCLWWNVAWCCIGFLMRTDVFMRARLGEKKAESTLSLLVFMSASLVLHSCWQ